MDEDSANFLDLIFDRDNPGIAAGVLSDILTAFKDLSPGPGATDLDAGLSVLKQASLDEDGTKGLLRAARAAFTRCSPQLQGLNKAIALFAIAFCDWHLDDTAKAEAGIREMMAVASPVSSTLETLTNPKVWGGTVAWIKGGTAIAGVLGGILGGAIGGFFNGLKHGEGHGEEAGTLQVLQTYGRAYLEWRADTRDFRQAGDAEAGESRVARLLRESKQRRMDGWQAEIRLLEVDAEVAESRVERRLRQSKQKRAHTDKCGETTKFQAQAETAGETPSQREKQVQAHCPACGLVTHVAAQHGRTRVICPRCSRYFGVDS